MLVTVHKTKIFDKLFFEEGVEEEDLHLAIIKHDFRDRKIFEKMMENSA